MTQKINNSGQAAIILILVAAIALIFYAIELNWSRIADLKARTWMAATTAASSVASNFASLGEQVLQQEFIPLDTSDGPEYHNPGEILKWDRTWIALKILILVVVIVILIFAAIWTGGAALVLLPYVLAIVIGLFVASMILEYAVITPGELDMWNKLQQNMTQPVDRFRESGISTALSTLVGDTVNVPDRFDMNGNGAWGFDATLKPKDAISRFGFYYTERLKTIPPPQDTAYSAFMKALDNLIKNPSSSDPNQPVGGLGFSPRCTGTGQNSYIPYTDVPFCDPQCTGVNNRPALAANSWWGSVYRGGVYGGRGGMMYGQQDYVPMECSLSPACTINSCGRLYPCCQGAFPLLYDSSLQVSTDTVSVLYRLGHDDEQGKEVPSGVSPDQYQTNDPQWQHRYYNLANASGVVFPMLSQMESVGNGAVLPVFNPPISGLPAQTDSVAVLPPASSSSKDVNQYPMMNFKAPDTACAESSDFSNGFFWKSGADRYCSGTVSDPAYVVNGQSEYTRLSPPKGNVYFSSPMLNHFPYADCTYMHDQSGNKIPCTSAQSSSLHPNANWPQDRLDDMVYGLHDLITFNQSLQSKGADTVKQWYPQVAAYIAPQCTQSACSSGGFSQKCALDCHSSSSQCYSNCIQACYAPSDSADTSDPDFANNLLTCNPYRAGSLRQFRDEANAWTKLLGDPGNPGSGGWLNQSFGDSTNMCSGTLKNIVTCLNDDKKSSPLGKSAYYQELDNCAGQIQSQGLAGGIKSTECQNVTTLATKTYPDCLTMTTYSPSGTCPFFTAFPNQKDKDFNTEFQQWLNINQALKDAMYNRYALLNNLLANATSTQKLFQEMHMDFDNFLNGPARNFMQAYLKQAASVDRLPPFAIYGWRDKQRINNNRITPGKWHLARAEVKQPTQTPWIDTWSDVCIGFDWTSIFLGPVDICNYYQFSDGAGTAWLRTTRWDQANTNQGGLVSFANKVPLWQFRFGNPRASGNYSAADIDTYCTNTTDLLGYGIGITNDTQLALKGFNGGSPPEPALTADEKDSYQGAFMINFDPRAPLPQTQYMGQCGSYQAPTIALGQCGNVNFPSCDESQWQDCCARAYAYQYNNWYNPYYRNYSLYSQQGKDTSQEEIANCRRYNSNICQTNNRLEASICQTTKCFNVVDSLLSQGITSVAGAGYGVPSNQPYHEQVYLSNIKNAPSFVPPSCPNGNELTGNTTTYGDCTY